MPLAEPSTNQKFAPNQPHSQADTDFHSSQSPLEPNRSSQVNTASSNAFATLSDVDDLKNSLQEIRSLLLRNPLASDATRTANENQFDEIRSWGYPHIIAPKPQPGYNPKTQGVQVVSPAVQPSGSPRLRSRSRSPQIVFAPTEHPGPIMIPTRLTDFTTRELDSVISDFSSIVIIATFLSSVSLAMLELGRNLSSNQETSVAKVLHLILQIFTSLSLSFNLSVAIVAGGAASSQSLRLRLGQRATEFSQNQALDMKLQLCTTLQYYGLLTLAVGTASLFGLVLNSPYAILLIIPVAGVIFYDSLYRNRVGINRAV